MTIEIADRLVKLRKKYGYSQEELADKLGLSRQAVSKWERAEASPDTDNLICLAKLYGVSLDELLSTDDDVDTIVEEQVKSESSDNADAKQTDGKENNEKKKDKILINGDGIYLEDEEGSTITINKEGINFIDECGNKTSKRHETSRAKRIVDAIEGLLFILAITAYILLGSLLDMWYNGWVVFFIPEIISSLLRSFVGKNASKFNMPFLATFTFFFVCMVVPGLDANLWHPMWAVFLAIPIYYCTVDTFKKAFSKNNSNIIDEDLDGVNVDIED